MSWIEPPLPGRNGTSRSSPQLPPLVGARSGTPSGSCPNFQDFLPQNRQRCRDTDRGLTAAQWSRKLPCGVPSQALHMVRTHLSPVENAMSARHITMLEQAVQDATIGSKYLQTISAVRRSRSVPAMQRHALEAALATHIVRAKVELDRWHTGVMEINELRRARNPVKLQQTLHNWSFSEDDPVVLNARADLARWKYIEEQMPALLKQAIEEKDMDTIKSCLKQLNVSGPSNVEGIKEARALMKRYSEQVRDLKDGINARDVCAISFAIDNWEFPEDRHVEEGRATIDMREDQLQDLKHVLACDRVNGNQLAAAVASWEFERDNGEYTQALEQLQAFRMELESLEGILREEPVNLLQLRIALDSWSFSNDPDSCSALEKGQDVLRAHEDEVSNAVSSSDGHALRELLAAGSDGQALGEEKRDLVSKATDVHTRHSKDSSILLDLVRKAPNLEAELKNEISSKCKEWKYSEHDPVIQLGKAWLRCHELAASCSSQELEDAAKAGFGGPIFGALRRVQALPSDSRPMASAKKEVGLAGQVWQTAGALGFGVVLPEGQQPSEVTHEAMWQHLRRADIARHHVTTENCRELKSLVHPPEVVHHLVEIMWLLLTGCSTYTTAMKDPSWRACQEVVNDARKFHDHMGEVPNYISTGRRTGIDKARAVDAKVRAGQFAAEWTRENMAQQSELCESLFVYIESIFSYDDLISSVFVPALADVEVLPRASGASFEAIWKSFLAVLKDSGGLPDSGLLGMLFLSCGGDYSDMERCESRAQTLLDSARERLSGLQSSLEAVCPLEVIDESVVQSGYNPQGIITVTITCTGKSVGKFEVTEGSTGWQLKQLIARKCQHEVPAAAEQKLLNAETIVRDSKPLAQQGIRNGATLSMETVDPSLLQRLENLSSAIYRLDSSAFVRSEAKHLVKAASYFATEGHLPRRQEAALRQQFMEFLRDATEFVREAVAGKRPQTTAVTVCERRIEASMFENAELPMYQFSTVNYHLKQYAQACGETTDTMVLVELADVIRKLHEEFLPLYYAWSAASEAVEEAEEVHRSAQELALVGKQLLDEREPNVFGLEPDEVLDQLESLVHSGAVVAAPHVEALSRQTASNIQKLLQSSDMASSSSKPRCIEKVLAAYLTPVMNIADVLTRLAKQLHSGQPPYGPNEIVYMAPFYTLMVAIFRILGKPGDPDVTFVEARKAWQAKGLHARLMAWHPLKDGSPEQLLKAQTLLIRLWGILRTGPFHPDPAVNERHQALFAWACLATSLLPLLPAALELCGVYNSVKAAADRGEAASTAEAQQSAWLQMREVLHRPEEPWWWLRLVGCPDPKGFYEKNGLALDAEAPLPEVKAPAPAVAPAPAKPPSEKSKSPQVAPSAPPAPTTNDEAGDAAEDSYAFDQDSKLQERSDAVTPKSAKQEVQEGSPDPYANNTFDDAEGDADPYADGFDAEADGEDTASPEKDAPALSPADPSALYSQDEFENENTRSSIQQAQPPEDSADFEAEFEKEDAKKPEAAAQKTPASPEQGDGDDAFEDDDEDDAGEASRQPDKTQESSRKESDDFEFEAEDGPAQKAAGKSNMYASGEFEFEEDDSPKAAAAPAPKGNDDFEDEDEYNDFEDEEE